MLRATGHVFTLERKHGPTWYAKYRLPSGRQVQKKLGPAWTSRGRPPAGYFTKRLAQNWLDDILARVRRNELPGMVATGATLADAAAEWLRYCERDRVLKRSTLTEYRHAADRLVRDLGDLRLEDVTAERLERWKASASESLSNRSVAKYLVILHGIFRRAMKVWGLPRNPVADVERPRYRVSDDLNAFSPEEIHALVRAAASQQDAALFLTAAFTGLRLGELLALQWGDVDFAGEAIRVRRSYNAHGGLGTPKSGKVRSVPMVPDVARTLAGLGDRAEFTDDEDLVFVARGRNLPRGDRATSSLQGGARSRRSQAAALPRPAAHVRHARRPPRRGPGGPGVDGALGYPDDDAVRPPPRSRRRGEVTGSGVGAAADP